LSRQLTGQKSELLMMCCPTASCLEETERMRRRASRACWPRSPSRCTKGTRRERTTNLSLSGLDDRSPFTTPRTVSSSVPSSSKSMSSIVGYREIPTQIWRERERKLIFFKLSYDQLEIDQMHVHK